jgi:ubiquinone/menaquinone biosynthesis C-methylase UbiE
VLLFDHCASLNGPGTAERGCLLDVCCGTGNAAAAALAVGALVTGVELDESMLRVAREGLPTVTFDVADAMHVPFPDNSFDVAVSTFGLSVFPGEPAARELVRLVRDEGRVVITSWSERGSILSAGGILRRAILKAQGRPVVVNDPTAWHDRSTVRDLFAPNSVQFYDEEILYQASSPRAVAAQYYDHHPQWLRAREVIGEAVYAQLREQATRFFDEVNEHQSEWHATDFYLAAVATLDSSP